MDVRERERYRETERVREIVRQIYKKIIKKKINYLPFGYARGLGMGKIGLRKFVFGNAEITLTIARSFLVIFGPKDKDNFCFLTIAGTSCRISPSIFNC